MKKIILCILMMPFLAFSQTNNYNILDNTKVNGNTITPGTWTLTGTNGVTYTMPSVTSTIAKLAGNTFTAGQNYAPAAGSTDSGSTLYTIFLNAGTRTSTATLMRISGAVSSDSYFGGPINADAIAWGVVNGAENGRITTSTGNMSLGSATDDGVNKLQVTGGIKGSGTLLLPGLASSSAATTGTLCWTTSTGNVNVDTTVACLASTRKVKQEIVPLDIGLAEVMRMQPVSYELKPEFNPEHLGRQVGLIAEEVAQIDNRLVAVDDKGDPRGVRYMQMTAVLIKAIQQQQRQIEKLKRTVKLMNAHRHSNIFVSLK